MEETRVCTRCLTVKFLDEFPKKAAYKGGIDGRCKDCVNEYNREYYKNHRGKEGEMPYAATRKAYKKRNPDDKKVRQSNDWNKRYGLTAEQYSSLLANQGGVCAICSREETMTTKGTLRLLSVDHDHTTGKVRGLLCSNCNRALGQLGDTIEDIERVLRYLRVGRS